MMNR
jgi:hypothetical protein